MSEHHHATNSLAALSPDGRLARVGQHAPSRSERHGLDWSQDPAAPPGYPQGSKEDLQRALDRLKALHEGWAGVADVVVFGSRAIPELRRLLFAAEPSGIFEPRCRAVAALAALGGYDVLIDFLSTPLEQSDPAARVGDEAVRSAAARALGGVTRKGVLPLLIKLAEERPSIGVVEALGVFGRREGIPSLIRCLDEDETRASAEAELRLMGQCTRRALLRLAETESPEGRPSNIRARRSAVKLLAELGIAPWQQMSLRRLAWDDDAEICAYACVACLGSRASQDAHEILDRLSQILPRLRGAVRQVAKDSLADDASRG